MWSTRAAQPEINKRMAMEILCPTCPTCPIFLRTGKKFQFTCSATIHVTPAKESIQIMIYTVFNLITAHTLISSQSRNSAVFCLQPVYFFSDFLYKGICCGYSFELHRLVDVIQMSTHNICLYKENQKKSHYHHQINLILIFYSVSLVGRYMYIF